MDKTRQLAITKIDLVDDDTLAGIKEYLPKKVPVAFISSVSQRGLDELKDIIWQNLTAVDPTT